MELFYNLTPVPKHSYVLIKTLFLGSEGLRCYDKGYFKVIKNPEVRKFVHFHSRIYHGIVQAEKYFKNFKPSNSIIR